MERDALIVERDALIAYAQMYYDIHGHIPLDLEAHLLVAGIDVSELDFSLPKQE
jgi:hypothetical protein